MRIEDEIKQSTFSSEYQKVHINVLFTAAWLGNLTTQSLKDFNMSWQQFNILRILRGLHPEPATVKLLTERMIDKMSNASRLVDKLVQKGYVDREAHAEDRRRVNVKITELGLQAIGEASIELDKTIDITKNQISVEEAIHLNKLLDKLRG